jgi:hypothetical protein
MLQFRHKISAYRLILDSLDLADLIRDPGARKRMAVRERKCLRVKHAIDRLRAAHPQLLRKLIH